MALIAKKVEPETKRYQVKLSGEVAEEVEKYMAFAGLDADYDSFFEGAAAFVLLKDKEFVKWKRDQAQS